MILKMLDSAHQKTLWLCILSKKLRSEKEYNVIISLSMQRNRKQLFHAVHRPPDSTDYYGLLATTAPKWIATRCSQPQRLNIPRRRRRGATRRQGRLLCAETRP